MNLLKIILWKSKEKENSLFFSLLLWYPSRASVSKIEVFTLWRREDNFDCATRLTTKSLLSLIYLHIRFNLWLHFSFWKPSNMSILRFFFFLKLQHRRQRTEKRIKYFFFIPFFPLNKRKDCVSCCPTNYLPWCRKL